MQGGFEHVPEIVGNADIVGNEGIVAILFDLGVSSPQLDRPVRGFSYWADAAPLDMRMDSVQTLTAATVVNEYSEADLAALIARNGEERYARRIAAEIVAARPLATTGDLVEAVKRGIPAAARRRGGHPARRTFQAIRMEVNRELPSLAAGLDESVHLLKPEGRIVVLAYHSLEDRMVKERFADWSRTEEPGYLPKGLPRAKRNAADPVAHPAPAAAVGGRSRGEPARSQRPPACGRASRAVTTVAAPTRRTPPARARAAHVVAPRGARRHRAAASRDDDARRRRDPPRRARTRRCLALFTVFALVSAVVFHVMLAQDQLQLDHLNSQITKEQRTYEQRRLTASLLASPQRIIQEAERLGLVVPPDPPQYLYVDNAPLPGNDDGSTADTIANWSKTKPSLGPQQP